jgi:hypothetical protein
LGLGEMVLCEPLLWTSPKLASNSFKDQVCVGDWFSSFKLSRLLAKKFSWHQNCKTNFSTPILLLLLLTGSHGWFQTKAFADTLEAYIGGIYIEKVMDEDFLSHFSELSISELVGSRAHWNLFVCHRVQIVQCGVWNPGYFRSCFWLIPLETQWLL